jgi:hypothetical protein
LIVAAFRYPFLTLALLTDAYLGMTVDVAVAAEGRGGLKVASRS